MGRNAEEGLAHDDKHRDVEDETGGQIMEIQPLVEHDPADKWVEGESQSADEVGEEHNPLVGSQSRNDLPCVRKPVRDVCGQVSSRPELCNVLLRNGRGRPSALKAGSGHG